MPGKDEIMKNEFRMYAQVLLLPFFMMGYIGAQTGSLIIQAVIAASVGIGIAVRLYWSRIKKLFGKGKEAEETAVNAVDTEEAEMDSLEMSLLPDTESSGPSAEDEEAEPVSAGNETGIEE